MNQYFAGYYNGRPAVYVDDRMGMIRVHIKNRRTIQAAHNIAKVWNAHERKKARKKSPIRFKYQGLTHEESEP